MLFFYPPSDNPNRLNNYTNFVLEVKTDGSDRTDEMKTGHFEKICKLNNLNSNVFELKEDKSISQLHVSKKQEQKQIKNDDDLEDNHKMCL